MKTHSTLDPLPTPKTERISASVEIYRRRRLSFITCLAVAVASLTAVGEVKAVDPWVTVDTVPSNSSVYGMATTGSGAVLVAGFQRAPDDRFHAMIARSVDGGATWQDVADFPAVNDAGAPNGPYATLNAVASTVTTTGGHYAVAVGRDRRVYNDAGALSSPWLVVESNDEGQTWTPIAQLLHPTFSQLSGDFGPWAAAVDADRNIYLAGGSEETIVTVKGKTTTTTTVRHWLIQRGIRQPDGSLVWSLSDLPFPTSKYHQQANVLPKAALCVGSAVYVSGGGGTDGNYWRIMKSTNKGATWTVADNYVLDTRDCPATAHSMAVDSAGNLYAAGAAISSVSGVAKANWIVRKGQPGGTNWTIIDNYRPADGNAWARAVTVGSSGVYVGGNVRAPSDRWNTRRLVGSTWTTSDDAADLSAPTSLARTLTADPLGNIFAGGFATDSTGVVNWMVRRRSSP